MLKISVMRNTSFHSFSWCSLLSGCLALPHAPFPCIKEGRLITVSASLLALHILHAKWLQQWQHPVIHEDSSSSQIWLHSSGAMALHDMLAGKALYTWETETMEAMHKKLHKPSGPLQITFSLSWSYRLALWCRPPSHTPQLKFCLRCWAWTKGTVMNNDMYNQQSCHSII